MKTFQYLNKGGKWIATQKKREEGTPLHVLHDSGSYRVFANVDKLPEGVEPSFRATA